MLLGHVESEPQFNQELAPPKLYRLDTGFIHKYSQELFIGFIAHRWHMLLMESLSQIFPRQ